MNIHYRVELREGERQQLLGLIAGGSPQARKVKRAQVLLAVDNSEGRKVFTDEEVAKAISVGTSTVYRTKRRFVELGLDAALSEEPRSGAARKTTAREDATLIALACSNPPVGRAHWTVRLLAGALVEKTELDSISGETVRRRLAENDLKPWQHKMWCIPKFDLEYVARMEDLLDLYAEPPDAARPVVCFDETPRQFLGETRVPVEAKPGRRKHYDYEYKRNGTANLFVMIDRHRSWRHVDVTDHHTNADFAEQMRKLVDEHYPDADCIRVVMDNLNTHKPASSMRRSTHPRPGGSYASWSSTSPRSTPAG